jgi:predicted secreted protein
MTGKDIIVILSQNGTALASTAIKSQDIQTQCKSIEKSSAVQQDWEEVVAGRKSWTLNVKYLVLTATKVTDLLYAGQMFDVTMKVGDTAYLTGKALMTAVSGVSAVGTLANGSFSLRGNGPLATPPAG